MYSGKPDPDVILTDLMQLTLLTLTLALTLTLTLAPEDIQE